jgi:hypothetical protein
MRGVGDEGEEGGEGKFVKTLENFVDFKDNLQISFLIFFLPLSLSSLNRLLLFICLTLKDMGCVCVSEEMEVTKKNC